MSASAAVTDSWNLPRDGGCRCGSLRFRISAPPLMTFACHCSGCRRMTGSAFSLTASIPLDGFAVTAGEPVQGGLRGELDHRFCPFCMSWVFTRAPQMPDHVNIRFTLLDDPSGFSPFVETCAGEKLPWAATPAVHSYARFPPAEDYPRLIEEFAKGPSAP